MPASITVQPFGPQFDISVVSRGNQSRIPTSDVLAIQTQRALNQPNGTWAITLTSKRDSDGRGWQHLLRPMDYIELRFGRYKPRGQQPQLVMRGFVEQAFDRTSVGEKPNRSVLVNGYDYGLLLLRSFLYFLRKADPQANFGGGQNGTGVAQLAAIFNQAALKPSEFLTKVEQVLLYNEQQISGATGGISQFAGNIPKLKLRTRDLDEHFIVPFVALKSFEGPVWNLLSHYRSPPVGELLIQDTDTEPELVWRWSPLHTDQGYLADPVPQDDPIIHVSTAEIMEWNIGTSGAQVMSYYFAYPASLGGGGFDPRNFAVTTGGQAGSSDQNPLFREELAKRYGFRPMEVPFAIWPNAPTATLDDLKKDYSPQWQKLGTLCAKWMDKVFSHNGLLEFGTIKMRGDERITPGRYISFKETGQEFYVEAVAHDFQLNPPQFETTLTVSRGLWVGSPVYPAETSGSAVGPADFLARSGGGDPVRTTPPQDVTSSDTSDSTAPGKSLPLPEPIYGGSR